MFASIKEFLVGQFTGAAGGVSQEDIALACAALLVEIARADERIESVERAALVQALTAALPLPGDALARIAAEAEEVVERSVSLFEFTSVLNAHCDPGRKLAMVEALWRVAAADGRVDQYEEYYIRKIAELLHVPHRELIRCKLKVLGDAG